MELFEKKFKQYLKEGDYWGYEHPEDEDAFLGYGANNYYLSDHFPEIREYFNNIHSELGGNDPGSKSDFEKYMTISNIRDFLGDDIADKFKDFAIKITEINEDYYNLVGDYTNWDFSGLELFSDLDYSDDKEEIKRNLSDIFGEEIPDDLDFDGVRLSLSHTYEDGEFKPYLLLGLSDYQDGGEYELIVDADEDSYFSVFDDIIKELKAMDLFD